MLIPYLSLIHISIGVSNFTIAHLRQAIEAVGVDEIATNQVEIHPLLQNRKLVTFARQQSIHLTAYMPLAYGKVLAEPEIQRIAAAHGASPAQVALAWSLQQGYTAVSYTHLHQRVDLGHKGEGDAFGYQGEGRGQAGQQVGAQACRFHEQVRVARRARMVTPESARGHPSCPLVTDEPLP